MSAALLSGFSRTPFHFAGKGALAGARPETLASRVISAILANTRIDPASIDDVIAGCAYPEGAQGNNIARIAWLLSHGPVEVSGMTLNRFCGSSMSAVHVAAAQIKAGIGAAYLCLGVESMSLVPQGGLNFSPNPELYAHTDTYISMGLTAENVAKRYSVSRSDQDEFALHSHQKAAAARATGRFVAEIAPVTLESGQVVAEDGCIRADTSLARIAALKPAFREDGVVTAATSSPLTDGAAGVLVTSEEYARRHNLTPLARVRSMATAGVDPAYMGMGPVPASRKALERAQITVSDLDVIEINEAFASQALACIRELRLPRERINLDGGGIAIGHPLGATGVRITAKAAALLKERDGRFALATQCIGGGQGIATVLERL
jgi:acetyl-CoA acyltransferase